MKVVVSVLGRFHAFDLARELERAGALERLITSYPKFFAKRYGIAPEGVTSLLPCELFRRTLDKLPEDKRAQLEPTSNALFERLATLALPRELDVFVGWSGCSLRALQRARSRGALGVIERGSAHIEVQRDLLAEEYELHGLEAKLPHPSIVERELREYEEADAIAVPSSFVVQTFLQKGFPADKLLVNPYGVDLSAFTPADEAPDTFRILFCGRTSLQKGAHYLLQAFHELALPGAELVFVGPIEPEIEPFRRRYGGRNVFFLGPKPQEELPKYYRRASVFCLPSIQEGMAMVLFQALASGLPLVITPNTGGRALIEDGQNGFVVPIRDVEALKERLLDLYGRGEEVHEMGRRSLSIVAEGYTWRDYGKRARAAYLERLGRPGHGGTVITSRRPGMDAAAPRTPWPDRRGEAG